MQGQHHARWVGGLAAIAVAMFVSPAEALDAVVGPAQCNETGLAAALAAVEGSGGGTITFDCGTATIPFTSYKQIAGAVAIDGGNRITLDGGNASAFFQIYASAHATLSGLTLQHGVFNASHAVENFGTLMLDQVKLLENVSSEAPVANSGVLYVLASTFDANQATASGPGGDGGAIYNSSGTLSVLASTFSRNRAGRYGGAIFSDSAMTVLNSTFNANHGASGGGAVYQTGSGTSKLDYVTVVGNSGPFGAGLYNGGASSTLQISRSIVSANATGNCDGVLVSAGYNLSDDTGCGGVFTAIGDLINQTLPMGALAYNGGPTRTMRPLPGNPAIDHVPVAQCAVMSDQRGVARPYGGGCDSGAVEADDLIFMNGFD